VKKKHLFYIFIALTILSVTSCARRKPSGFLAVSLVRDMMADTTSAGYRLVSSYDPSDVSGCIAIIGDPYECMKVSEEFMESDVFDNVDGRSRSDGLPDFAGENIVSVYDFANAPYSGYVAKGNYKFLRELTVRETLASLDTKCAVSPYDRKKSYTKPGAKIIILTSPLMSKFGYDDVQVLFESAGGKIPVISVKDSSESAVSECYHIMRQRNMFTHNVAYPKAEGYLTVPASGLPDNSYDEDGNLSYDFKYTRTSASGIATYELIPFSNRYVTKAFSDSMKVAAPKIYGFYVYQ
jgi:hypothetical protein